MGQDHVSNSHYHPRTSVRQVGLAFLPQLGTVVAGPESSCHKSHTSLPGLV